MHGQGNYSTQVGQAPSAPQSGFQNRPVVAPPRPPPLPHHGPLPPQPQVIQPGRPPFHFRPGILAYQHTAAGVPPQGLPVPAISSGMSSGQSFVTCPQPPEGNASTQMSYSYPTSEQQCPQWSQNAHQFPPAAPLPAPSAYALASSQENALERGPLQQPSFHALPPQQPPNASSHSSFLRPNQFGPSGPPMRQHSYPQTMGTLPPPPPPPHLPPPLPSSSPPVVPPLPPTSPPSDILLKNDGSCSLKGVLRNGNNLILEPSPPGKPVEYRSLDQIEGLRPDTEKIDPKVEFGDTVVTCSPGESDMDMEDDITLPDVEKKNLLLNNSNDECISTSQDDHVKEQIQDVQDAGTHMLLKVPLGGSSVLTGSKDASGADESGRENNGQTNQLLDNSSFQHEKFSEPFVPVVNAECGYGNLSGQVNEGSNPFNLLQDYASDDASENEGKSLGDVSSQSIKGGSTNFDTGKVCNVQSELPMECVLESNKNMCSKSMNESANVMEPDKKFVGTGKVEDFSGSRGPVFFDGPQLKDSLRNYDTDVGSDGANMHPSDAKSNAAKLNVDEFGRLIREGVSDSDSSDSPRYKRRQARRSRKRSRSRSQSPHDRRRWRSPRRKERRGRSRSGSPRRSRSRSPFMRHDIEFTGDKLRREKAQLPVCFDFLRGKCYRGTTCRYSHHQPDKSERKRYSRGKQLDQDKHSAFQSPNFHEENSAVSEKEMKHSGAGPPVDMSGLKDVNDSEEPAIDSTTYTREKEERDSSLLVTDVVAGNLSGYSADDMIPGKEYSLFSESVASDKVYQIINQHGQRSSGSLFSGSSVVEASVAVSDHVPSDKPDVKEDHTSQTCPPGNPVTNPYFTEEVPSQPLKDLLPSSASHLPQSTFPLPSVSQVVTVPISQPILQDYNMMPSVSRYHVTPKSYSPPHAPRNYQQFHFPGPSNSSSNSFALPPLPVPSHSHFSNMTTGERSFPSQHVQHSSLHLQQGLSSDTCKGDQPTEYSNQNWTGQFQVYSLAREPDQRLRFSNNFDSSLSSQLGDPYIRREDCLNENPVQGMNLSQSFAQAQPNSLSNQSPSKGMQGSVSGNPLSDSTRPYFHQASHGQQYSVAAAVSAQFTETVKVSSSIPNIIPDFPEKNQPSYIHEILGSRISNYFNPYASTFDLPLGSKFSSNASAQENNLNTNTRYGTPLALTSTPGDGCMIGGTNMLSLSCGLPTEKVIRRPGGDQYDPLFDSIEPVSNFFTTVDHQKHEAVGDSDDVLRLGGSGRILDTQGINQEGGMAVSASDSVENEEFGETADAEVGAVLNGSPSDPNDAPDMNGEEVEIDQVKTSGKKKKSKEKSMKLFKISIAAFVKEVLKPSWRQGNMSKEAFKTIVKKTVDKVSGAMKSHRIPRSQTRINEYIDSSRGKLTKLVMGYVNKYVKV